MMMKHLAKACCVVACLFNLPVDGNTQTTVQIGDGTSVNGGSTASIYAPICRISGSNTSDFSRSNILYTSTELATAGITNGVGITKLAFNKVGTGASLDGFTFKIYMRNSTTTAPLSTSTTWAGILASHTLVYSRDNQMISDATGWVEFILDMPFEYTGQNIEIAFDSDMSAILGNPSSGPFDWQYTTGFADYIIGVFSGSASNIATLNGTSSLYKHRPNILITYTATCSGTPNAGDAVTNLLAVCPGTMTELNLVNHVPSLGLTYTWQSSSTLNGSYTNISSASNSSAFTFSPSTSAYYRASVACGGSASTSTPVEVVVIPSLNGTYSIDPLQPVSPTNFTSFTLASNILACGIAGPVVFNVAAGTVFNEQLLLDSIPGTSAINTVTFNGNGSTLTFANPNQPSDNRAVIRLNGADHIIIDSLTIVPTGLSNGFGVQLLIDADSNVVKNCTINGLTNSTSTALAGIVINSTVFGPTATGASYCDGNLLLNNKIDGGYLGIAVVGNGSTSMVYNNKIVGNTITNFNSYGIYINGNDGTVIDANEISRATRSVALAAFYGIYVFSNSRNCIVSRNRIHNTFDQVTGSFLSSSGIYFTSCDATEGNENVVVNNILYNFSGQGQHYGLYNSSSDYVKYYHNSVYLNDITPSGSFGYPTRAFYQTQSATGIEVKNNIFKVTRQGIAERWALYFETLASSIESNNNVVYIGNVAGTHTGYYDGANRTLLADWVTASGQDANSKQEDPTFTDSATGNLLPTNSAINDIGAPVGVTIDILGNPRNPTTPDPGAYEVATPFIQYIFTGTGNWDVPGNWMNSEMPPASLPAGYEIVIDHAAEGECILNVPQTLLSGSKLTVLPSKNFRVNGNLTINN